VENKIVYYKETGEYLHVVFGPGSQRKVHCHTIKLELVQKVATVAVD
jgi:hypothetical protein